MTAPKPPQDVEVVNAEPLDVTLTEQPATIAETLALKAAAAARVDADILRTDDQRRISGIWERTQQMIALMVVMTTTLVSAILCVSIVVKHDATAEERAIALTAFTLLATLTGSVIGFYFGRTNHTRVGGVGAGAGEYQGR